MTMIATSRVVGIYRIEVSHAGDCTVTSICNAAVQGRCTGGTWDDGGRLPLSVLDAADEEMRLVHGRSCTRIPAWHGEYTAILDRTTAEWRVAYESHRDARGGAVPITVTSLGTAGDRDGALDVIRRHDSQFSPADRRR